MAQVRDPHPRPEPCTCRCCSYDAAASRRLRAGEPDPPPGVPKPTALDMLDCQRLRCFYPTRFGSDEERRWWERHAPHLLPWLREEVLAGRVTEPLLAQHGACCLIIAGQVRGLGGELTPKKPFSWERIDGHELLFEGLAHGGLLAGWDPRVVVHGMRSFAAYLGRRGVIDEVTRAHLVRELDAWEPCFVRCLEEAGGRADDDEAVDAA